MKWKIQIFPILQGEEALDGAVTSPFAGFLRQNYSAGFGELLFLGDSLQTMEKFDLQRYPFK